MEEIVKGIVRQAVLEMIKSSASKSKIQALFDLHEQKVHFVPQEYRVLNGVLQSLNIKFGNFIEKLIALVVDNDPQTQTIQGSGKKLPLVMTSETDTLIDTYITSRQLPDSTEISDVPFRQLLSNIIEVENTSVASKQKIVKDVDALFVDRNGVNIYVEIKYNDDHDTGKFVDINRKAIKTYAGLVNYLRIDSVDALKPIIYYFNPTRRWGSIYLPSSNVLRGSQLFDQYFETKYETIDTYLRQLGQDPSVMELFDQLYHSIRRQ